MAVTSNVVAEQHAAATRSFWRIIAETYLARIMLTGLGFTITIVVSRGLGPSGRGLFAIATAIAGIGIQFGNLGLHASNTYYVAKNVQLLPVLIGNTLVVSFGVGGAVGLIGLALDKAWPNLLPVHGLLLLISFIWIPFGLGLMLLQHLLLGMNQVRTYNGTELAVRILGLAVLALATLNGNLSPEAFFAATFTGLVLSFSWALFSLLRLAKGSVSLSFPIFSQHVGLGAKAYLIAFFGFLVLRIDLVMVKYLLGSEAAGYYSISETMAENMLLPAIVVGTILFPKLSAMNNSKEKLQLTRNAALVAAGFMAPLILVTSLLARPLIKLVFGNTFLPAAGPFICLMPGSFFIGLEIVIVQYLNSLGFPKVIAYFWLAVTILNIGINFWAIPAYGITGAAIVSTISYCLIFILILFLIYNDVRSPEPAVCKQVPQYGA